MRADSITAKHFFVGFASRISENDRQNVKDLPETKLKFR